MSPSNSMLAYKDCFDLMDQALNADEGVRTRIGKSENIAWRFRLRLNKARVLKRKMNKQIYEPGHILYDGSEYDELIFTMQEDTEGYWWVYLEKMKPPSVVEPLSAAE